MSDVVTVVARFKAKAGMEERLKTVLAGLLGPTRAEVGCLNYDLHQSRSDPREFLIHENWASLEALAAHGASEHLQRFRGELGPMIEGGSDVTRWTKIA